MKNKVLVLTEDGSCTFFLPEINEHYHSIHGAISESKHVFIEAGLNHKIKDNNSLNILQVGLGTGLNAALTLFEAESKKIKINYYAVEPYPLSAEDIKQLNYSDVSDSNRMKEVIHAIHTSLGENEVHISPYFVFNYLEKRIQETDFENNHFNIVYFDAFSPDIQPDMWTADVFQQIFNSMKPGGILVTYVAKGQVRRIMKSCGFIVEKLAGFANKREMTRAIKPE